MNTDMLKTNSNTRHFLSSEHTIEKYDYDSRSYLDTNFYHWKQKLKQNLKCDKSLVLLCIDCP